MYRPEPQVSPQRLAGLGSLGSFGLGRVSDQEAGKKCKSRLVLDLEYYTTSRNMHVVCKVGRSLSMHYFYPT